MTILLTGSTGFIGSHIKKALSGKHKLLTPTRSQLYKVIEKGQYDFIIHCAWAGTHKKSTSQDITTNLRLFFTLFKQNKPMIYFGSGIETSTPEPDNPYQVAKYAINNVQRANLLNLRLYGVYGEGEGKDRFIPTALKSKEVKIPQDNLYSFTHVSDVVKVVEYFLAHRWESNVYEVVPTQTVFLSELALMLGRTPRIQRTTFNVYRGFNNLLIKHTGIVPISIQQGLRFYETA